MFDVERCVAVNVRSEGDQRCRLSDRVRGMKPIQGLRTSAVQRSADLANCQIVSSADRLRFDFLNVRLSVCQIDGSDAGTVGRCGHFVRMMWDARGVYCY